MTHPELAYLNLLQHILENGTKKEDRTGQVHTVSLVIKCVLI